MIFESQNIRFQLITLSLKDFKLRPSLIEIDSIFSFVKINRRSASEDKYSKSLPDRENFGGRQRPTQLLNRLTPKPHLRQLRSQTSSLLSSTSITDTSDEDDDAADEDLRAYNERRHRHK